jgi:hypothetical protein
MSAERRREGRICRTHEVIVAAITVRQNQKGNSDFEVERQWDGRHQPRNGKVLFNQCTPESKFQGHSMN